MKNLRNKDYRLIWCHHEEEVEVTLQMKRSDQTEALDFDLQGAFYIQYVNLKFSNFDHV